MSVCTRFCVCEGHLSKIDFCLDRMSSQTLLPETMKVFKTYLQEVVGVEAEGEVSAPVGTF